MKLTILTENTALRPEFQKVHGLSIHMETKHHRILMDVGPGGEFLHNAALLDLDISGVDLCAISHGHDDHGGGLGLFLQENSLAPVYLSERAFHPTFSGEKPIGLDRSLEHHPQIRKIGKMCRVDEQVLLLSDIPGDRLLPAANHHLMDENGRDGFSHEMVMLVEEDGVLVLLGGCAHRGIVNILCHVKETVGRYPDAVVSGLHLSGGPGGALMADEKYLDELAEELLSTGAMFYSCHCTGQEGLKRLKNRMGEKLVAVSAGQQLVF